MEEEGKERIKERRREKRKVRKKRRACCPVCSKRRGLGEEGVLKNQAFLEEQHLLWVGLDWTTE